MVSVTDSGLRKSIAEYVRLALLNRKARLPERRQRSMQKLKAHNVEKERELRSRYLREDADDGE